MNRNAKGRWAFAIFSLFILVISSVSVVSQADDATDVWKAPSRASRRKNPIPADAKSIDAGKEVYVKQCLSCHGVAGKGDGPSAKDLSTKPHDLSDPKIAAQTDGALFWKITNGKKPMPAFEKLTSEEDRWNVINYIRVLESPVAQ